MEAAQDALEAQVPRRVVLHEVSRDQDRREIGTRRKGLVEHGTQTRIGLHAAQISAGVTVQMRVGDL